MHIIGILMAVIGAAAFWYWRVKAVADAGAEVIDGVGKLRGKIRRRNFAKKADGSVLTSIEDPGIAAAVLFHALAAEKGAQKAEADAVIRENIAKIVSPGDVEEVFIFTEWAAQSTVDPNDVARKFRSLWQRNLTSEQRYDLVAMAAEVSACGSGRTKVEEHVLQGLKQNLLNN